MHSRKSDKGGATRSRGTTLVKAQTRVFQDETKRAAVEDLKEKGGIYNVGLLRNPCRLKGSQVRPKGVANILEKKL